MLPPTAHPGQGHQIFHNQLRISQPQWPHGQGYGFATDSQGWTVPWPTEETSNYTMSAVDVAAATCGTYAGLPQSGATRGAPGVMYPTLPALSNHRDPGHPLTADCQLTCWMADSGAGVAGFKDTYGLSPTFQLDRPVTIGGIVSASNLTVTTAAMLDNLRVLYDDRFGANCLSSSAIVDAGWTIDYHRNSDSYQVVTASGQRLGFHRYVMENGTITKHYLCHPSLPYVTPSDVVSTPSPVLVAATTVQGNLAMHTPQDAKAARSRRGATGFSLASSLAPPPQPRTVNDIVTTINKISVKQGLRDHPDATRAAITHELQQMLRLRVFRPLDAKSVPSEQQRKAIYSSMFLKEKLTPQGIYVKCKARLVAGGNLQDKSLYGNMSSPTVTPTAVLVLAGIAARDNMHIATIDIGGAFLNADMAPTGVDVDMVIDKYLTSILVELDPSLAQYVRSDGTLLVRLLKALYGTVEAARLWYDLIIRIMVEATFAPNPFDQCVLNRRGPSGKLVTVALYVDDLLVMAEDSDDLLWFKAYLESHFPEVTYHSGKVLDYVGMTLDFAHCPGTLRVTMKHCIDDIINTAQVNRVNCEGNPAVRHTPATGISSSSIRRRHAWMRRQRHTSVRTWPSFCTSRSACGQKLSRQYPTSRPAFKCAPLMISTSSTASLPTCVPSRSVALSSMSDPTHQSRPTLMHRTRSTNAMASLTPAVSSPSARQDQSTSPRPNNPS